MEEQYGVYFGNKLAGKVRVFRQGLYYRFVCRCQLTGKVVCRLNVTCGTNQENLGVVVPMDGGFGLDTSLPIKRLGSGQLEFQLIPKHEAAKSNFIPICPEEPFAYIERLKKSYLIRKNAQYGIEIRENAGTS